MEQRDDLQREINMKNQILLARKEGTIPGHGITCTLTVRGFDHQFAGAQAIAILFVAYAQLEKETPK